MECRDPGSVTSEDLLTYATEQRDRRIADHLVTCPVCAEQTAAYATLDRTLSRELFRRDCPLPETLGEMALEMLAPEDALTVRQHLALCPHCSSELSTLTQALNTDPLEEAVGASVSRRRILAQLLPAAGFVLGGVGLRGSGAAGVPTYQADHYTVTLSIEPDSGSSPGRWELLGLVIDDTGEELPEGAGSRLLREGRTVAEVTADETGGVLFTNLTDGLYSVELELKDCVIAIENVAVSAPENG